MKRRIVLLLFFIIINQISLISQNIVPEVKISLEYKKYTYCDYVCDAIFIKIKNETGKNIYIQSNETLDSYIRIFGRSDDGSWIDYFWDENNEWYKEWICNEKIRDSFYTQENYYNYIIKSINNPDHFELDVRQLDSIYQKNNYSKEKDKKKSWYYPDKVLFLKNKEEFTYIHFIDNIKDSQSYDKNDSIKLLFNFKCHDSKMPETIFGYERWENEIFSDTLSIKLEE